MPLNYLFQRHQISLMRASAAPQVEVRRVHQAFAAAYADRIEALVAPTGAIMAPLARA